MNAKNWKWILGAIVLAGALAVGGYWIGRSAGDTQLNAALSAYNELRAADDALLGRLGTTLGGALKQSERLNSTGSGLEQSIREVAVLSLGLHDAIIAIARYEKERSAGSGESSKSGAQP